MNLPMSNKDLGSWGLKSQATKEENQERMDNRVSESSNIFEV